MKVIEIDIEILSGTPVFCGTRVPVKNLIDFISEGFGIDEFLEEFPTVERKQVQMVLELFNRIISNYNEVLYENFA
jgi:uncharacterized protein (DUF433 family)